MNIKVKQNTQFAFEDPQILQVFLCRVAEALSLHQDCKTGIQEQVKSPIWSKQVGIILAGVGVTFMDVSQSRPV